MKGITRATLSDGTKSSSVLQLAQRRGAGPRMDRTGREGSHDRNLLKRLEAENRELRNQAIQLALQIQVLRHVGRSDARADGDRAREVLASASRPARISSDSAPTSSWRLNRSP